MAALVNVCCNQTFHINVYVIQKEIKKKKKKMSIASVRVKLVHSISISPIYCQYTSTTVLHKKFTVGPLHPVQHPVFYR